MSLEVCAQTSHRFRTCGRLGYQSVLSENHPESARTLRPRWMFPSFTSKLKCEQFTQDHGSIVGLGVRVGVGGVPSTLNRVETLHVSPKKIWTSYSPGNQAPGSHSVYP